VLDHPIDGRDQLGHIDRARGRADPSSVTEVTPAIRPSRVSAGRGTVALNPEITAKRRSMCPPAWVTSRSARTWAAGSVRTITATGRPAAPGLASPAFLLGGSGTAAIHPIGVAT